MSAERSPFLFGTCAALSGTRPAGCYSGRNRGGDKLCGLATCPATVLDSLCVFSPQHRTDPSCFRLFVVQYWTCASPNQATEHPEGFSVRARTSLTGHEMLVQLIDSVPVFSLGFMVCEMIQNCDP